MTVHFASGQPLYSTDFKDWSEEGLKAFSRVVNNLSMAPDIRFCSIMDGAACFVYVRTEMINFLEFSQEEYELMAKALAKEETPEN